MRRQPDSNNRIKITAGIFLICIALLIVRLGYIQIVMGPVYSQEAMQQQYKDALIMPERGIIYDRTGKELAVSVPKHDLWIESSVIKDEHKQEASDKISKILDKDSDKLLGLLKSDKKRFAIEKNISTDQVKALKEADIKGIWFEESSKRYYPYGKFAAYVIGHVSNENAGLSGVESSFNSYLKGIPGREIYIKDARNREISTNSLSYQQPIAGSNVVLTIDEVIQHHAERAVQKALEDNVAKRVIAIAMDPKTGDILAMASKPDFDPNDSRTPYYPIFEEAIKNANSDEEILQELYNMWRNPAVNDIYEPGSPFKVVTASAALEEGLVYPQEWFKDIGYAEVAGRKIKNWTNKPFGNITFTEAVEQSVNSVFIAMGQRLGPVKFTDYIDAFGFGRKTGIDLPGEGEGIQYSTENMGPVELATTSFGQSISVTPIQMITAVCAVANDGMLMKPRIVKEITDSKSRVLKSFDSQMVKRVISKETANQMMDILESVVSNGSGGAAKIEGYRVAGKTGTAQKVINGRYEPGFYISSFVAIAPVEDPKLAVIVIVDEPRGGAIFGSTVAGPVVRQIMSDSLRYMGIKPNILASDANNIKKIAIPEIRNMKYSDAIMALDAAGLSYSFDSNVQIDTSAIVMDTFPKTGENVPEGTSVMIYLKSIEDESMIMPDLTGKTFKEVESILKDMQLELAATGSGKVKSQMPSAGTKIYEKNMINVEFE